MASPQLKKGFTRIANEIMEHVIKLPFNGTQLRILLFIWRCTYGFQTTENDFSITYIAKKINASRSQVDRELKVLIDSQVVNVLGTGEKGARVLSFNKNYDEWGQPESKRKSSLSSNIENNEQEEKPKKKRAAKQKYGEDNSYYKMALYFHEKVAAVAKEAGVEHLIRKANLQTWADDFRKLVELDGVTKKLAKEVMDWVVKDSFWRTNVLSAKKLREKFGDLAIKMNTEKKPKQAAAPQRRDARDIDIEFQRWIAEGKNPDEFNWN
ncbi:replication protein [Bacillus massiliglaciei]|uniref:replication protein n=1 Tax=Bacillus massiliglaciei TaxID=1816693 RepID=UPI000DA60C2A|nr:replication protein [Bacillus massiliglaciei]